jgi:hypothetical protein
MLETLTDRPKRVLQPMEKISEILFTLIMVLYLHLLIQRLAGASDFSLAVTSVSSARIIMHLTLLLAPQVGNC